jgi:hypothetical protein
VTDVIKLSAIYYHDVVDSGAQTFLAKVHSHGSVAVSLGTLIALSVHPTPWCFDCEFSNPWGHVNNRLDDILGAWLLIAPFIAGLFAFKKGWLVPASMVVATLVTQPLAGVPGWSLRENEGPIIVILGLPACAVCLLLGYCVRGTYFLARRNLQPGAQV